MSLQMLTRGEPEQMLLHWEDHRGKCYHGFHHLHVFGRQVLQPAPLDDTCQEAVWMQRLSEEPPLQWEWHRVGCYQGFHHQHVFRQQSTQRASVAGMR